MDKWSFLCVALLVGCSPNAKYDGFSVTETGLNYTLHQLGESDKFLKEGDVITIHYSTYSAAGEAIDKDHVQEDFKFENLKDTGLMEFLGLLSMGDSGSYVFPFGNENQLYSCKIVHRYSREEAKILKLYPASIHDIYGEELHTVLGLVSHFLGDSIHYLGGMFMIQQIQGSGNFPDKGDEVVFDMESTMSNGKPIESTKINTTPFSYVLGDQDQVIEGIDYGIRRMKKGGKATLIIPSHLAYGSQGSSTGLIPAFTPLIYSIDLLDVSSSKAP